VEVFAFDTTNNRISQSLYGLTLNGPFASRGIQDDATAKRLFLTDTLTRTTNPTLVEFPNSTSTVLPGYGGDAPYIGQRVAVQYQGTNVARSGITLVGQAGANYCAAGMVCIPEGTSPGSRLSFLVNTAANFGPMTEAWYFANGGHLIPASGSRSIGFNNAGQAPSNIYSQSSVVVVSDERTKTDVVPIDTVQAISLIQHLAPETFRTTEKWVEEQQPLTAEEYRAVREQQLKQGGVYLESTQLAALLDEETNAYEQGQRPLLHKIVSSKTGGQRRHSGFRAQAVRQALLDSGLDPAETALFTLADPSDDESNMALRYEELIAWLTAALQGALTEIDGLKTRVTTLETA
jgi:hypothetical protein